MMTSHSFSFHTPPSIRHEIGGIGRIGEEVLDLSLVDSGARVMIVTDAVIYRLGLIDKAVASFEASGLKTDVFTDVEPEPSSATILEIARRLRTTGIALVAGIGGGSSMDAAKLAALLARSDQSLEQMYGVDQARGKRLPLVLAPTTAGTGSEVTPISIVTTQSQEKKGVVTRIMIPDLAILDAAMTTGLPPHVTAATGMDAMVHAIESFTSTSPNRNPISETLSRRALSLLGANIRQAVSAGQDLEARSNMLLGAMFAGQAFANSPVAAVHALAYPIGGMFHVPHGLSNALVLKEVMTFNAPVCGDAYASLAPCAFPDIDTNRSSEAVCADFIDRLAALSADIGLEPGLRSVGISRDDIRRLSVDALKQERLLQNNPRTVTLEDALGIYARAL